MVKNKKIIEEMKIVKKQLFYTILLSLTFVFSTFLWAYFSKKANLKDDSMIEELIEEIIEKKLDLHEGSFDLTPSSQEKPLA